MLIAVWLEGWKDGNMKIPEGFNVNSRKWLEGWKDGKMKIPEGFNVNSRMVGKVGKMGT